MANEPKVVDFDMWGKMPYWTIHEAVMLVNSDDPLHARLLNDNEAIHAEGIWKLAQRAVDVERLSDPIEPILFLEWADQNALVVPKQLLNAVIKFHGAQVDWKAESERQRVRAEKAEAAFDHYMRLVAKRDAEIAKLSKFAVTLQADTASNSASKVSALQKSLNTVLKLLGGLVIAIYNFNPHERRSDIVKQIQSDLDLKGISLDEDTIRKWVKEAARFALAAEKTDAKPKSGSIGRVRPSKDG